MQLARKFSPMQAGFRRGFSTQSYALYSHEITLRNNLHQVFIDFKAAYDTVLMCRVLQILTDCGALSGLISLIISLFMNGGSKIVVNGALTLWFQKSVGCFKALFSHRFSLTCLLTQLPGSWKNSFHMHSLATMLACFLQMTLSCSIVTQSNFSAPGCTLCLVSRQWHDCQPLQMWLLLKE
ncbi:hypothetical protein DSO57_1037242 [Entomophthora muscae]|uniref:Uncharacterized protein n=1 Tax=Entomophthora muscae TaxID=34485 RepID=A0ACC2SBS1_9FUNG|nr:hypothetical protein DSO57_1037242 [Entomophthora muscae]